MEKNLFIAFEGIDGCGKDTQLHKLVEYIKEDDNYPFGNKYSNIWITREPTKITPSGIEICERIRSEDVDKHVATKLYIQDRKEHTLLFRDILKHSHILTSRYDISTLSYQMTQGMDFDELYDLHNYEGGDCLIPDITLVFDLSAEVAFKRMGGRNSAQECFEKIEFQKELEKNLNYCVEQLEKKGRKIILVNANQSIEDVTKEMCLKIHDFINDKLN